MNLNTLKIDEPQKDTALLPLDVLCLRHRAQEHNAANVKSVNEIDLYPPQIKTPNEQVEAEVNTSWAAFADGLEKLFAVSDNTAQVELARQFLITLTKITGKTEDEINAEELNSVINAVKRLSGQG